MNEIKKSNNNNSDEIIQYINEDDMSIVNNGVVVYNKNDIVIYEIKNLLGLKNLEFKSGIRCELENDCNKKQIVVAALLHHNEKYFLFKNIKGDMKTRITAVQGHINSLYKDTVHNIQYNMLKELLEETRWNSNFAVDLFNIVDKASNRPIYIVTKKTKDPSNISTYHVGIIFDASIPGRYTKYFDSNEPDKNIPIVFNITHFNPNGEMESNMDTWLFAMMDHIKSNKIIK